MTSVREGNWHDEKHHPTSQDLSLISLKARLVASGGDCAPPLPCADQRFAITHPKTHLLPHRGVQSTLPPPQMGHCFESLTINISLGCLIAGRGGIAFPPGMSGNLPPWALLTRHVTPERHLLRNYFISCTEWLLSFLFISDSPVA